MDDQTMDMELDKLVEDSGFLRYHAEYVKRREFNTFDVLRYAEYEIRHSNVLAWLLDPGQTHGIGRGLSGLVPGQGEQIHFGPWHAPSPGGTRIALR